MKQMNDTQTHIDAKSSRNKLFSIAAICLSIMASTNAMGQDRTKEDNDSIVRAMYGFIDQESNTSDNGMDENEILDLSRSNYGTTENTSLVNEMEYINFLSNPVYLNRYFTTPSFYATRSNAQVTQH